jgi:hypothetical protein
MEELLNIFNWEIVISTILGTYIVIKIVDEANGAKAISKWLKKAIMLIISLGVGTIYYFSGVEIGIILPSLLLSPFAYSYGINWILDKCKLAYKK